MLADQIAMQAAASGFPVIIGCPTMPIGPHDHNLTPPAAMLRHFLDSRLQLYLDFILNLVDVRDAATGLILAMERGKVGHRYVLGSECISLKEVLRLMAGLTAPPPPLVPVPPPLAQIAPSVLEFFADHST